MGKTSLAMTLAREIALEVGEAVGIFSLEMSEKALSRRLLSAKSQIPFRYLSKKAVWDHEKIKLKHAISRLEDAPIYIDDPPTIELSELKETTRRWQSKHEISLLVIDYYPLMRTENDFSRRQEVFKRISEGLSELSKELEIVILALTQIDQQIKRPSKCPRLRDLSECGHAYLELFDQVWFLYRNYVHSNDEQERKDAEVERDYVTRRAIHYSAANI